MNVNSKKRFKKTTKDLFSIAILGSSSRMNIDNLNNEDDFGYRQDMIAAQTNIMKLEEKIKEEIGLEMLFTLHHQV